MVEELKYSDKVFGLRVWRGSGGDQADVFNLIQNSQNTSVHLNVAEEQWRIAGESKRQAGGYGPHARNLSGLRHSDATHAQ